LYATISDELDICQIPEKIKIQQLITSTREKLEAAQSMFFYDKSFSEIAKAQQIRRVD